MNITQEPTPDCCRDLISASAPAGFRERLLDATGATLGTACAIKCIGVPVAAALLPAVATFSAENQSFLHSTALHAAFLILAAPGAAKNLIYDEICRRKPLMAAISATGLLLMTAGTFGHSFGNHSHSHPRYSDEDLAKLSPEIREMVKKHPNEEFCGLPFTSMTSRESGSMTSHEHGSGWANWAYAAGGITLGAGHLRRITQRRKGPDSRPS